jgi:zinc resistance-associated protein
MKKIFVAAAVAALAGSGFAYAQSGEKSGNPREERAARPALTQNMITNFADARIARLKAGLMLTPEQEKNWPPVEATLRDSAKRAADRMVAWRTDREKGEIDALTRLGRVSDALTERAADLKKFADAARPLYNSLDDRQKQRFASLVRRGGRQAYRAYALAMRDRDGRGGGWHRRWHDEDGPRWRGRRGRDSDD